MKINILLLAVLMGFVQLLQAQTQSSSTTAYEPAPNTVKVDFAKGYTTSQQNTAEGNNMIVAYEFGTKYNLSLTTLYPLAPNDDMVANMESNFNKLIADQADYVLSTTGVGLNYNKQTISSTAFEAGFAIDDYTYAYRVFVVDNVYYMLSASSLTADSNNPDIVAFLNSFVVNN